MGLGSYASSFVLDELQSDPDLVKQYGDIADHGGYMKLEFYNWETKEYENLGVLPLAKSNENQDRKAYSGESFWNTEPDVNIYDVGRELKGRAISLFWTNALKKLAKSPKGPFFIDLDELNNRKVKFAIQNRLRKLGSNSIFEHDVIDEYNINRGTYRMEYQINKKGKETFKESFTPTGS